MAGFEVIIEAVVNGGAQCWGQNTFGQLGDGSKTDSLVPIPVPGLTTNVGALAAGNGHTCALVNGGVQCWGQNETGQLGNGGGFSPVPVLVLFP